MNPAGVPGEIIFNVDHKVLQFCNSVEWMALGGGGDAQAAGLTGEIQFMGADEKLATTPVLKWDSATSVLYTPTVKTSAVLLSNTVSTSEFSLRYYTVAASGIPANTWHMRQGGNITSNISIGNYDNLPALFVKGTTDPLQLRVGIGTAAPDAMLHVKNTNNSVGAILANASEASFQLYTKTLDTNLAAPYQTGRETFRLGLRWYLQATDTLNEDNGFISFYRGGSANGGWLTFSTDGAERLRINPAGNVGINTTAPSYRLHVNGSVAGTGAYNALSDARFKTNITDMPYGLDELTQLRPVTYEWITPQDDMQKGEKLGLIAQEVEAIFPQAVSTAADGTKSIAYDELIPVLINAIKELESRLPPPAAAGY